VVLKHPLDDHFDNNSFSFELANIKIFDHSQLAYKGAEITLQALFECQKTVIRMDLGFGERVEQPIDLTDTSKGPLFERKISVHYYPKEFITLSLRTLYAYYLSLLKQEICDGDR
jgi:hypothetical protein